MGADLYIKGINTKSFGFEVSTRAIQNGYFRDCYNYSGLFCRLSANLNKTFSWWQTANRAELFNKKKLMTVNGAKILLDEMKRAKESLDMDNLQKVVNCDWSNPNNPKYITRKMGEDERDDFLDHLDLFTKFLEIAITNKKQIEWSV